MIFSFFILESMTNISYVAGLCQTSYKLLQEVQGFTVTREQVSNQLWEQFRDTTCFQKIIGDIEDAFLKVLYLYS